MPKLSRYARIASAVIRDLVIAAFFGLLFFIVWKLYFPSTGYIGMRNGFANLIAESHAITIAMVDKGRPGKPQTMGLIPATRQVMIDAGGVLKTAGEQVKQSSTLVNAASGAMQTASNSVAGVAQHVQTATDAIPPLLNAGTGTLNQAKTDLATLNDSIGATKPLIQHADLAVQHFDALIQSKDLSEAIGHVNETTGHIAGTTGDLEAVSDDLKKRYFAPVPLWKKTLGVAEFGVKAGNKTLGWW